MDWPKVKLPKDLHNATDLPSIVDDVGRDDLVGDELLEEEAPRRFSVAGGHAVHRGVVRVRYRGVVLQ